MCSVASLLNPVKIESRDTPPPSSSPTPTHTFSLSSSSPRLITSSAVKKKKTARDGAVFCKGKIKGEINYSPYEYLDRETLREVQKFHVFPLGKITEFPRHIPYNSEKKGFLEKTGRESFEVFQYVFKVPADDKDYTVMWDYNIGLVRITPFFKCRKYTKTTPAKMLAQNPGLKDITHSITGGALVAQGYWMPFNCARDICATFCHNISPALIPIFGLSFPSLCIPPEAPEYGRMTISSSTIATAAHEAEANRKHYSSFPPARPSTPPFSPRIDIMTQSTNPRATIDQRVRLKRALHSYETDIDTESSADSYCSPVTPLASEWRTQTALNTLARCANLSINTSTSALSCNPPDPFLSAIPRFTDLVDMQIWRNVVMDCGTGFESSRRLKELIDTDEAYDGEESANASVMTDDKVSFRMKTPEREFMASISTRNSAETKAAYSLINLSLKDREVGREYEELRFKRRRKTTAV